MFKRHINGILEIMILLFRDLFVLVMLDNKLSSGCQCFEQAMKSIIFCKVYDKMSENTEMSHEHCNERYDEIIKVEQMLVSLCPTSVRFPSPEMIGVSVKYK